MTEMEPGDEGMDSMLRRSMAAPVPSLAVDFDQRLLRELKQSSGVWGRYSRILLTGYGVLSVVTSVVVMRGQGLGWGATAATIVGPLALVVPWARRATRTAP